MTHPTVLYRVWQLTDNEPGSSEWPFDQNAKATEARLSVTTYPVLQTTPKGFWVQDLTTVNGFRFILNTFNPASKRFAWPTIEEAKYSFYRRCLKREVFLQRDLKKVQKAIRLFKEPLPKEVTILDGYIPFPSENTP